MNEHEQPADRPALDLEEIAAELGTSDLDAAARALNAAIESFDDEPAVRSLSDVVAPEHLDALDRILAEPFDLHRFRKPS